MCLRVIESVIPRASATKRRRDSNNPIPKPEGGNRELPLAASRATLLDAAHAHASTTQKLLDEFDASEHVAHARRARIDPTHDR